MDKPIPIIAIEQKFAVETIKVNRLHFWPYLRNYIGSQLHFNKDQRVTVGSAKALYLIKSLFFGFFNLFSKADYLFFSSSDQRKYINGFYTNRMDFFIEKLKISSYVLIEQPNPKHYSISKIKNKKIYSKSWLYLIERSLSKIISVKIENESVIKEILQEYNLKLNYFQMAKLFLAQYKTSTFFYTWIKPKIIFTTTAYINCARVKAAHDLNIKVVELQHGIVNKSHYGYNISKNLDSGFYPDYFLSFGKKEIEVFDAHNFYVSQEKVLPSGSFYIDHLVSKQKNEHKIIADLKKKYSKTIAMSCQDAMDELWVPFFKKVSENDSENAYILMPRHKSKTYYDQFNFPENVFFIEDLNTYEIILQADIHTTINSTTAIESISLGTPNVLMNINNLAKDYLLDTLSDYTYYAENPEEFMAIVQNMKQIDQKQIASTNEHNIVNDFDKNIDQILKRIEK